MKGIYGRKEDGARSVALSGGYEDDEDKGDTLYVASSSSLPPPHLTHRVSLVRTLVVGVGTCQVGALVRRWVNALDHLVHC